MRYRLEVKRSGSRADLAGARADERDAGRESLLDNAGGLFAAADAGLGEVPQDRLASIDIPSTIVECKLSPRFLRRSCERLRELTPQARTITLEQSGHHVAIAAREELVALLRDVVARRDGASAPAATS